MHGQEASTFQEVLGTQDVALVGSRGLLWWYLPTWRLIHHLGVRLNVQLGSVWEITTGKNPTRYSDDNHSSTRLTKWECKPKQP